MFIFGKVVILVFDTEFSVSAIILANIGAEYNFSIKFQFCDKFGDLVGKISSLFFCFGQRLKILELTFETFTLVVFCDRKKLF